MAPGDCDETRLPFDSVGGSRMKVEGEYVLNGYIRLNKRVDAKIALTVGQNVDKRKE